MKVALQNIGHVPDLVQWMEVAQIRIEKIRAHIPKDSKNPFRELLIYLKSLKLGVLA